MKLRFLGRAARLLLQQRLLSATWLHCERQGLIAYLKLLRAVRLGMAGALLLLCAAQMLVAGLIGGTVTALFLFVDEPRTRLWLLLGFFGLLLLLSLIVIGTLLSQRLWLKHSGAARQIAQLQGQEPP